MMLEINIPKRQAAALWNGTRYAAARCTCAVETAGQALAPRSPVGKHNSRKQQQLVRPTQSRFCCVALVPCAAVFCLLFRNVVVSVRMCSPSYLIIVRSTDHLAKAQQPSSRRYTILYVAAYITA